jgi:enamine deaminase RidA (YjgF/YER057c/UK114 family)
MTAVPVVLLPATRSPYVQVLLGDIGNYKDINTWWRKQFPDPATAPARSTFQAGALPFGRPAHSPNVGLMGGPARFRPLLPDRWGPGY